MLGAKWDRSEKTWYIPEGVNTKLFEQWIPKPQAEIDQDHVTNDAQSLEVEAEIATLTQERAEEAANEPEVIQTGDRVYLAVSYPERFEAKELGAKWDKEAKSWFMEADNPNLAQAEKWLPEKQAIQTVPAMAPVEEFADKLRELGCVVEKGHPFMDGKKHRIETIGDKAGERSGFYVGHLDGRPAGYIKNNRTGESVKWKAKGYSLSADEKAKLAAEAAQKIQERKEQQERARETAVKRIEYYKRSYQPIQSGTPYLNAKGISPQEGIFTDKQGEKTFIPVYNAEGELRSMQYIQADGTKRFAKDSEQEGGMHVIGQKDLGKAKVIVLAEGYATAASINEATDDSVACVATFNSGNLPIVAASLNSKYPKTKFIVAGDDDLAVEAKNGNNPGKEKALEAATLLGTKAIFPIFATGEQSADNKNFTDFNDLAQKSKLGRDGVKKQVNEAIQGLVAQQKPIRLSSSSRSPEELVTSPSIKTDTSNIPKNRGR